MENCLFNFVYAILWIIFAEDIGTLSFYDSFSYVYGCELCFWFALNVLSEAAVLKILCLACLASFSWLGFWFANFDFGRHSSQWKQSAKLTADSVEHDEMADFWMVSQLSRLNSGPKRWPQGNFFHEAEWLILNQSFRKICRRWW